MVSSLGLKRIFFCLKLDITPLECHLNNIMHVLLIICGEHWPSQWPLLASQSPAWRLSPRMSEFLASCSAVRCPRIEGSVICCFPFFVSCFISLVKTAERANYLTSKHRCDTTDRDQILFVCVCACACACV